MTKLGFVVGVSLVLAGCASDGTDGINGKDGINGSTGASGSTGADGSTGPAGPQLALPALYTLINAAATPDNTATNSVSSYLRATNGNLSRKGSFPTTGTGTGKGLGSQGALAFDAKKQRLFAVNAGNNTISMLALDPDGVLTEMSTVASGGKQPVSITVHADTVYVANQGDRTTTPANISGFRVSGNDLVAIDGSTKLLSAGTAVTNVRPTDIAFTPDGSFLVVAEEVANMLDTFKVMNGVAQPGTFNPSANGGPFAFDFSPDGFLVVANVAGGGVTGNTSTVSSYQIMPDGTLTTKTAKVETNQGAACWIVMAGDFAYIANTQSGTLSSVDVATDGTVTLKAEMAADFGASTTPIDLALAPDRGFLYSLIGKKGESGTVISQDIHVLAIQPNGDLDDTGALLGLPASASGLVAR